MSLCVVHAILQLHVIPLKMYPNTFKKIKDFPNKTCFYNIICVI